MDDISVICSFDVHKSKKHLEIYLFPCFFLILTYFIFSSVEHLLVHYYVSIKLHYDKILILRYC